MAVVYAGAVPAPRLPPRPVQVDVDAVPDGPWDVAVLGAGPAGSMAALVLARLGRRVLLLDRSSCPRGKVCGDALIPDALRCLANVDLVDEVRVLGYEVRTVSIYSAGRVRFDVPSSCVTLKRERLDAFLANRAVEVGACFARAHVRAIQPESAGVRVVVGGRAMPFAARHVITATGADVSLLGPHGLVDRAVVDRLAPRRRLSAASRAAEPVPPGGHPRRAPRNNRPAPSVLASRPGALVAAGRPPLPGPVDRRSPAGVVSTLPNSVCGYAEACGWRPSFDTARRRASE